MCIIKRKVGFTHFCDGKFLIKILARPALSCQDLKQNIKIIITAIAPQSFLDKQKKSLLCCGRFNPDTLSREFTSVNDKKYWLGLSLFPGMGPKRLARMHDAFGDLERAWNASEYQLKQIMTPRTLAQFNAHRSKIDLNAEMTRIERAGAWLLTLGDDRYPHLLKELDDAPPVLYIRGAITAADDLALSIVGTRKASRYGQDVTGQLAQQLARQQVTIVSGLAQGIDTIAHQSALDAGGRTIAVLGSGIDVLYPPENRELARKIVQNGAVISEFPLGTRPIAANFPRRNRIVSGLALGVLVTEAPANSGALITASLAGDQGREVFAVPGNILNASAAGTNRLIQDGAKLVMDVTDILGELDIAHTNIQTRVQTESVVPTNDVESRLLAHLNSDPIHIDDLARLCDMPISEISSTLTILELKGIAQMVGNMRYSLVYKH